MLGQPSTVDLRKERELGPDFVAWAVWKAEFPARRWFFVKFERAESFVTQGKIMYGLTIMAATDPRVPDAWMLVFGDRQQFKTIIEDRGRAEDYALRNRAEKIPLKLYEP